MADGTPKFEAPAELRAMAERGVEQAKLAFANSVQAAQQALSAFDQWLKTSQAGAQDVGRKAMTFAQRNVLSALEYAQNIAQAQNLEEVVKRQTEFVRSQIQVLGEQARELSETAAKLTTEGAKDLGQNAKAAMDKLKKLADSVRSS
jgi:phasin